ncbi:glyceraldehyde 3-phosphate dehydrogenase NAD-binding domain-containing protein, partial [Moraxella caviae]|uniref:glyceraldehyde 3-phosphate dehydrogenase NAD-binding domain-containing protein n=1 Tax=Moraxella caviae TaxID=34060 RepID=UPI001F5EA014
MTQQNSPIRLAINGFGRIGRNVLRAYLQRLDTLCERVQIVAINDVWDADTLLHLLKFDSTHGRLSATGVQASVRSDVSGAVLTLTKDAKTIEILLLNQKNPSDLPWQDLRIDVVLECTGHFRSYRAANLHRIAGAKQVIIGAAPFDEVDASIVMGVNDDGLSRALPIISGVSCTTQALGRL